MSLTPADGDDEVELVFVDDDEEPFDSEGFDLGSLLQQAQSMQQQLMAAQAAVADEVVEGVAGGGVVRIQVTGGLDFRSVTIDPAAVDPKDVEMLQDLVLAALHDAVGKVNELSRQSMPDLGAALGGFGDAFGGLLP